MMHVRVLFLNINLTALLFIGYAEGSHYTHTGAAVNSPCLPKNTQWGSYTDDVDVKITFTAPIMKHLIKVGNGFHFIIMTPRVLYVWFETNQW